jgi:hypothetical protein
MEKKIYSTTIIDALIKKKLVIDKLKVPKGLWKRSKKENNDLVAKSKEL